MNKIKNINRIFSKFATNQSGIAHDVLIVAIVVVMAISGIGYYITTRSKNSQIHAQSGSQWCTHNSSGTLACLNAWSGGPWIRVYTHKGAANNYFNLAQAFSGNYFFQFKGSSGWYNHCIGDAYNDPGITPPVLSSLDQCPSTTNGGAGGWGTNFTPWISCENNTGWTFKNNHTGKFLAPEGFHDGDFFRLDGSSSTPYCFRSYV